VSDADGERARDDARTLARENAVKARVLVPESISVKVKTLRGSFFGSAHDEHNSAYPGRAGLFIQREMYATRPVPNPVGWGTEAVIVR
jgi:hypothetical protein